jgi:hypothetical protein
MSTEDLEKDLFLHLGLMCSVCGEEYYAQDHGWSKSNATEADAQKMVQEYLPKLIGLGWCTNAEGNVLCPECNLEEK